MADKDKKRGGRPVPRPNRKSGTPTEVPHTAGEARAKRSDDQRNESQRIALLAAQAGLDKKANGVEIIDVVGKVDYADFLVLMTGQSDRHVSAIASAVDSHISEHGLAPISVEGLPKADWVLLDFIDVVVHVFQRDARGVYDLDGLWMDAKRVAVPTPTAEPGRAD